MLKVLIDDLTMLYEILLLHEVNFFTFLHSKSYSAAAPANTKCNAGLLTLA